MARVSNEVKSRLRGLVGFGVTAFHPDFSIDLQALRQNAASLAEHCDVVVPLGNNGEIFSLSPAEQKLVGEAVVAEVDGRKPVLVGVGYSLPVARELAQAAEGYGADGILVLPPSFTSANDDGLFAYYRSIADAIGIGMVLFQTPSFNFSLSLLCRLARIPNIIAMKDEHGDMKQFVRQLATVGDRMELICGVGEILAPSYFALGVKAFTSGIVNFMPQTSLRIHKLLHEERMQEATRVVETETLAIFDLRGKRPGYTTAVIKEAMQLCGMTVGPVRPPLAPLLPEDREELRSILHRLAPINNTQSGDFTGGDLNE
jgi:5-dehydro-4-deoxyglucarate dehydratase